MNKGTKITKKKFLDAIPGSYGNVSHIARRLGVARNTVYKYMRQWNAEPLLDDERENWIDLSESKLLALVKKGDFNAIKLVLERIGAGRGWGEKKDVAIKADVPIQPIICFKPTDLTDGSDGGGD